MMLRWPALSSLSLSFCLVGCVGTQEPVVPPEPTAGSVSRRAFEVDLGGWTSQAELVHPAEGSPHGAGPFPVVLLIHGNGPHDMDVTLPGPDGTTKIFATIADALAARGFAVVRYHKRFVKGPGKFDARFWKEQSTFVFTQDAGKVLDAALAMPACDRLRIVLHGWSEGTAVAAALAIERGDIDALVLQGPVGLSWRETVRSWILDTGLPYAQPAGGGPITGASLVAALRGKGGMVAKLGASFFADPATMYSAKPAVSPILDKDKDGQLDPDTEVRAAAELLLDFAFSPQGNVHVYAEGRTVPTVTAQAPKLTMPVLILQGTNDASTPLRGGQALAAALRSAGKQVDLWELPGLGHTLGPAASPIDDHGRAPDEAVLVREAGWLKARVTTAR